MSSNLPDADGTSTARVTVRLTDSVRQAPLLDALYETDAVLEFPSPEDAYALEDHLTRRDEERRYYLTPDHEGDATFFLRCGETIRDG